MKKGNRACQRILEWPRKSISRMPAAIGGDDLSSRESRLIGGSLMSTRFSGVSAGGTPGGTSRVDQLLAGAGSWVNQAWEEGVGAP